MGSAEIRDYDSITSFLGSWGPFERRIFFALAISIIPNGLASNYIVFVAATPPHECFIPENYNISETWKNVTIPLETVDGSAKRSSCSRLNLEIVRNYSQNNIIPNVDVNVSEIPLESCVDGWTYSKEIYQSTIVTEWDLVCENAYKAPLTTSIHYIGALVGTLISGQLSDKYGRKPVLFAMMALHFVSLMTQIFSTSWEFFAVTFFLVGAGENANYIIAYVLGAEILGPKSRGVFASIGAFLSSAVGSMAMPAFAYFLREWWLVIIPTAASCLIYIPLWWIIPESPRWLLSQGKVKEAEAILRHAAKKNNTEAPKIIFTQDEIERALTMKDEKLSITIIFSNCNVFSLSIVCAFLWMVNSIVYISLTLNTANLHGDPYLNSFLSAMTEVPAYIIAMILLKYCSRHFCQFSTLFVGGTMILCVHLIPIAVPWVPVLLEMLGKFGLTASFCVTYAIASELFPTVIRNTAMGFCSMTARIGSIIAPFVIFLGQYFKALPHILMGSLAIFCAVLCLVLPETYGKTLPETLSQMQQICGRRGKKEKQAEKEDPAADFQCEESKL